MEQGFKFTLQYDVFTRKRWLRLCPLAVGRVVQVSYQTGARLGFLSGTFESTVTRIGKRCVWVANKPDNPNFTEYPVKELAFEKTTGHGWGTSYSLFPLNDEWESPQTTD